MDNRWRAQETLFASVRFLSDGSMETYDSCHGHNAGRILGDVVAHDPPDFVVGILGLWVV